MKKIELEEIEEIKKITKLTSEGRNKIRKILFDNIIIATDILLFFVTLMILPCLIQNSISVLICKTVDMILLIFSIFLFEKAYKKDSGSIAINGIEMLVLAIFTMFAPYGLIRWNSLFLKLTGIYFMTYYIGKSIVLSLKEKKKYMESFSDIKEIVKRESKDKINEQKVKEAQEKKEKQDNKKAKKDKTKEAKKEGREPKIKKTEKRSEERKSKKATETVAKEKKKEQNKKATEVKNKNSTKPKSKTNTTKKKTAEEKTTKKESTEKKTTKKVETEKTVEQPKRGRGRPRKETVEKQ